MTRSHGISRAHPSPPRRRHRRRGDRAGGPGAAGARGRAGRRGSWAERSAGCTSPGARGLRERLRGWLGHGYAEPRRADRPIAALRPCDPRVHALAARATHAGDRHALLSLPRLEAHRGPAGGAGLQPRLGLAARDDRDHARRRDRDRLHHRQPGARGPALPRRRAPRRRLGLERRIGDPSGNRGLQARLGGHGAHLPRRHRDAGPAVGSRAVPGDRPLRSGRRHRGADHLRQAGGGRGRGHRPDGRPARGAQVDGRRRRLAEGGLPRPRGAGGRLGGPPDGQGPRERARVHARRHRRGAGRARLHRPWNADLAPRVL